MQPRYTIRMALLAAVLVLAACQEMDPYTKSYVWQPTGANAGNIAAMVANPNDLIRGRGVVRTDSRESNAAIGHIWSDTPKPLLDPGGSGSTGAPSGSGSGSGSGGGGGGGGAPPAGG
jgi:type IV pilus biogenesis protein CpaD/CtpE